MDTIYIDNAAHAHLLAAAQLITRPELSGRVYFISQDEPMALWDMLVAKAGEIKAKGVDEVYCLSVNDAFVMDAWAKDRGAGDDVTLLADGSGDFTKAVGLEMDGSKFGMGLRSQRYAAIIEDGVVKHLGVEAPMKFEVSSADAILAAL